VNLYSAFLKKNPKRAACASLVEREEKGFEVAPKRWKRKTVVSKVSRKWVPIWRAGICKWTFSVRSKFHTWEVEMTTVSRSQVATTRNAGYGLAVGRQVFRSHLVQTSKHLDADSEPNPVDNVQPDFAGNKWVPGRTYACSRWFMLPSWRHVATCRSSSSERQSGDFCNNRLGLWRTHVQLSARSVLEAINSMRNQQRNF